MMKYIFNFLTFCLIAVSCSFLGNDGKQEVNITNNTTSSVMVDAWDMESSNTVDPNPSVAINKVSFLLIESEGQISIPGDKIKGNNDKENIRLFLYKVEGDSAYYQQSFSVRSDQKIKIQHGSNGYYLKH